MPLTPPLPTRPLEVENVEVVAHVGTSASPPAAGLPKLNHQEPVEVEAKVVSLHPYMPLSDMLVNVRDSVLANPEVGFAIGTSLVLPEDHKALESITGLKELQAKGFQYLVAVNNKNILS